MWQGVIEAIENGSRFVLSTHRDPDEDGIGSQMALRSALMQMGKEAIAINPDPLPVPMRFLDPARAIIGYEELDREELEKILGDADTIFVLDLNQWGRLAKLGEIYQQYSDKVIFIDHHPLESPLTRHSVCMESSSSTGELIYTLLAEMEHPVDPEIARSLYCAIIKDTGAFRFENTSARVLEIAGKLVKAGARPDQAYKNIFERTSLPAIKCMGLVLNTLELAYDNRLAHIHVTQEMLKKSGAEIEETENFVNLVRAIEGIEVCFFFREKEGGAIRVSLRSRSDYDVNVLAEQFGGGGHKRASGASLPGPMDKAISTLVGAAGFLFD